ncbi:hypothetical protein NQ317_009280 [Molorchus minor]|uniref:Uncharacterized protein n=1 Tax=Molorchus minor TaxID=1323400 RepID=A0ABQ9J397_9CUCU|nr:hypothetical protein NQ317_009280 [Molorchus minor]
MTVTVPKIVAYKFLSPLKSERGKFNEIYTAMPFDDVNIKRLHDQQVNKRWKFRSKVVDQLSEQVKSVTIHLLEPDITKRWKVEQILNSDWLGMDSRLTQMTPAEEAAFSRAQAARKALVESLGKKQPSDKNIAQNEEIRVLKAQDAKASKYASITTMV